MSLIMVKGKIRLKCVAQSLDICLSSNFTRITPRVSDVVLNFLALLEHMRFSQDFGDIMLFNLKF